MIVLAGCSATTVCTAEGPHLEASPKAPTITVGQTVVFSGQSVWCSGNARRDVAIRLTTADTSILLLNSSQTAVIGRALGSGRVDVHGFDDDSLVESVVVRVQ